MIALLFCYMFLRRHSRIPLTDFSQISPGTITFLSYIRYIYHSASVQFGTLVCFATSSNTCGLVCSFYSSDREFAADFLQIPPRRGHPCLKLTLPTVKACSGLTP
ncbi:hypothetical protein HP439_17040 [Sphingobacterium shayense]|nr:hypothetical protein [Sphingobacterium shayense]